MSAKSQAGTPEWTAPEVLRGQVRPSDRQTDPPAEALVALMPLFTLHCTVAHVS